ncbi:MAG: thiamine-phosphate pyrophosphorylase [Candidatus Margulisiibacteriota bacterium]
MKNGKIMRVLDANINRAVEGLRVMEEVTRLVLDQSKNTAKFKKLRSQIRLSAKLLDLQLMHRDSLKDVGKNSFTKQEAKRETLLDIFSANSKRVEEALRVLEEFSKLININASKIFKTARFEVYSLEKKMYYQLEKSLLSS